MNQDERRKLLNELNLVEADMRRLEYRIWNVRRQLQERWGIKEGYQPDDNSATIAPYPPLDEDPPF